MYDLAMHNLVRFRRRYSAASSHRTGIKLKVLPGDVMALTVLFANGELDTCSHDVQGTVQFEDVGDDPDAI